MKIDDKKMEVQILEAAQKLFLEQGFAKTTTGQIAKLAGCNQALVHYYYRTKDNLFDKIFEDKIRLITTNILAIDSSETPFEQKISKMIKLHFEFLQKNPKLAPFVINEISSNFDRLHSLIDKLQEYPKSVFAQMEAQLKKEIEKGSIRSISTKDLLITIVSLNVTPFLMLPVIKKTLNLTEKEVNEFLEQRKQEITTTVLARLKK